MNQPLTKNLKRRHCLKINLNRTAGVAKKVAGFFGLSPAIEGPLSGGGAPYIRGLHFSQDIARGISDGTSAVEAASRGVALATTGGYGSGGGAGGSSGARGADVTIRFESSGTGEFDQFMLKWIRENARIYGGGGPKSVQIAFGRTA